MAVEAGGVSAAFSHGMAGGDPIARLCGTEARAGLEAGPPPPPQRSLPPYKVADFLCSSGGQKERTERG